MKVVIKVGIKVAQEIIIQLHHKAIKVIRIKLVTAGVTTASVVVINKVSVAVQ